MKIKRCISVLLVLLMIVVSVPITTNQTKAADTKVIYEKNNLKVEFVIVSKWETGFEGKFVLTNTRDTNIENWRFKINFNHEITSIWDGEIESHVDNEYIIKYPNWIPTISPGGKVNVGFIAKSSGKIDEPSGLKPDNDSQEIDEMDYIIKYQTKSDWKDGFAGEISITNNTDSTIEAWELEFDFSKEITNFWTADIISHEGNHYKIRNQQWNGVIKSDETITLGFDGKTGDVGSLQPTNYKLVGIQPNASYELEPDEIDTDGDGLPDEEEKKLGLDPNNPSTNGVPDNEYCTEQKLADSNIPLNGLPNNEYSISAKVDGIGFAEDRLSITESFESELFTDNKSIIGKTVNVDYAGKFNSLNLDFTINNDLIDNSYSAYAKTCDELKGIKRFQAFQYDTKNNILLPIQTEHNISNSTLSVKIEELGPVCIIDLEKWLDMLGIEPIGTKQTKSVLAATSSTKFWVLELSAMVKISLNQSPKKNSKTDTDKDGLTDSQEIEWKYIKEKNGKYVLPTMREQLNALKKKNGDIFNRLGTEYKKYLDNTKVLPIRSNPTKKDTDGDGKIDPADTKPLIFNPTTIRLDKPQECSIGYYKHRIYTFKPSAYHAYNIYSTGNLDLFAEIYTKNFWGRYVLVATDDNSGANKNFKFKKYLKRNKQYYIKFVNRNSTAKCSLNVKLNQDKKTSKKGGAWIPSKEYYNRWQSGRVIDQIVYLNKDDARALSDIVEKDNYKKFKSFCVKIGTTAFAAYLVGKASPKVVDLALKSKLPEGFHISENGVSVILSLMTLPAGIDMHSMELEEISKKTQKFKYGLKVSSCTVYRSDSFGNISPQFINVYETWKDGILRGPKGELGKFDTKIATPFWR